ncbi:PH domain-containing protein [Corallococcus sp. 4LFB]|uniref:PH domain-containing protein n=1 Tax=Corallococcus sp. 4LFB TaxID=3383249 RepID=UPI0039760387
MSAEHAVDPDIAQALDAVQRALREEQAALPAGFASLQARVEQLQAEQDRLTRELEAATRAPSRRPDVLAAPFEVESKPYTPRRVVREFLPWVMMASTLLFMPWDGKGRLAAGAFSLGFVVLAVILYASWRKRPVWRFTDTGIEARGEGAWTSVLVYSRVRDADAHATHPQRGQGLGTLVVTCAPEAPGMESKPLLLKNVPEPERLAAWIRSHRGEVGGALMQQHQAAGRGVDLAGVRHRTRT